jgi:hypothetical protein
VPSPSKRAGRRDHPRGGLEVRRVVRPEHHPADRAGKDVERRHRPKLVESGPLVVVCRFHAMAVIAERANEAVTRAGAGVEPSIWARIFSRSAVMLWVRCCFSWSPDSAWSVLVAGSQTV